MDMRFPPRRRGAKVELAALLARTSAMQSATPTALAQIRLEASVLPHHRVDQHVGLFADGRTVLTLADHVASFAPLSANIFSARQSS